MDKFAKIKGSQNKGFYSIYSLMSFFVSSTILAGTSYMEHDTIRMCHYGNILMTFDTIFHDFPRPSPDSETSQASKMCNLSSMNFCDFKGSVQTVIVCL